MTTNHTGDAVSAFTGVVCHDTGGAACALRRTLDDIGRLVAQVDAFPAGLLCDDILQFAHLIAQFAQFCLES